MLLQYLLKNAAYSSLTKFVSPNFFQVVSGPKLLQNGSRLLRNRSDAEKWSALSATLASRPGAAPASGDCADIGERALILFFHQILTQTTWVLDFRAPAFKQLSPDAVASWNPEPFFYEVTPEFSQAVRSLYLGFYRKDDALFDEALAALNLLPAKETLLRHFGAGEQTNVRFELKTFQATFAEVFAACARERRELHPDFFVLGLSLLCLYQNLESQGRGYDVRGAFLRALAASPGGDR